MTPTASAQDVEAEVARLMILAWKLTHACEDGKSDADAFEAAKALQTALRAALTQPTE